MPSEAGRFVADIKSVLARQMLYIPECLREADIPRHCQADELGLGLKIARRMRFVMGAGYQIDQPA